MVKQRLGKAKKDGYPNKVEEFNKFKRGQQRIKNELEQMENEKKMITMPPLPQNKFKEELVRF